MRNCQHQIGSVVVVVRKWGESLLCGLEWDRGDPFAKGRVPVANDCLLAPHPLDLEVLIRVWFGGDLVSKTDPAIEDRVVLVLELGAMGLDQVRSRFDKVFWAEGIGSIVIMIGIHEGGIVGISC